MRGIIFVIIMVICGCAGDGNNSSSVENDGGHEQQQIDMAQAKFLFEIKCSACHPLSRPKSARMNYDDWLTTIDTMIENGAVLSDEEVAAIAMYLSETYGEDVPL